MPSNSLTDLPLPWYRRWLPPVVGVVLLLLLGGLLANGFGGVVLDLILGRLDWLRQARDTHPLAVYCGAFLLYVLVAGLSLPGAALLTLAYGWMFGFWRALLLVSFSSTAGATVSFLLSRHLLGDALQRRFGRQLAGFNAAFQRDGAFYLFTLRLIPAVPFFVINAGMGLTSIRVRTYWWVSQLGMLPGTAVYVYAGTALPGLEELRNPSVTKILSPQLLVAFALLGVFPLLVRKVFDWFVKPVPVPPP